MTRSMKHPAAQAAVRRTYLKTSEVAGQLHVSPKTVSRWAKEGKLPFMKTMGGHRRYPSDRIAELRDGLRSETGWAEDAE